MVLFLIGLVIYLREKQPLLVSIIFTLPLAVLVPLVAVVFILHSTRRENIIQIIKEKNGIRNVAAIATLLILQLFVELATWPQSISSWIQTLAEIASPNVLTATVSRSPPSNFSLAY